MEKIQVAVIEDNHDLNQMLVEDIRTAGYDVNGFQSVEDFDASVEETDIIILDINLPGENGFEFASRFRKSNEHVYIVALSARAGVDNRVNGYRCGIDNYLEKPTSSLEIVSVINRYAVRSRYYKSGLDRSEARSLLILQDYFLIGTYDKILLKERERALLTALTKAQERRLSYKDCIFALGNVKMEKSSLGVFIGRLRQKIKKVSGISYSIQPIRGWGYVLALELDLDTKEEEI